MVATSTSPSESRLKRIQLWPSLHFSLAVLVCIAIPGASWLDGSGSLAWTMYAGSATYRLRIAGYDDQDKLSWISPTAMATRSAADLQAVLSGSEGFRHGPQGITLRNRLPTIAAFACEFSRAQRVELTLEERRNLDAPIRTTRARQRCDAGRRLTR